MVREQAMSDRGLSGKVALVTGGAHRIGAEIARSLHRQGAQVVLHYRRSQDDAEALKREMEASRPDSVTLIQADLSATGDLPGLIDTIKQRAGGLDVLVNNASSFYPTPLGTVSEAQWDDLIGSNLKGPFFLSQAAAPLLSERQGCIVNLVDIHADRPLKGHPVYSMAKAGVASMTRALARELAPQVRVNGVAPGAILWPEQGLGESAKREILDRIALGRPGEPADIARTVLFLIKDAPYITGQIIAVDGGRSAQH